MIDQSRQKKWSWLAFGFVFSLTVALSIGISLAKPVGAAPPAQGIAYAGSSACATCHKDIHADWQTTRHAAAFSSPIFQQDWQELKNQTSCLECHTTGYDSSSGTYSEEGVTCESCHGPFNPRHPAENMSITPNADLCATCHKTTTDEWRASVHGQKNLQCQSCHNPHSQTPLAPTVTALCTNCHKDRGDSFTHSTHANSGLECSNCHMYTSPRTGNPIMGLVPTGHTFAVGSETCIGCHQDTVHTRDELVKLAGHEIAVNEVGAEQLKAQVQEKEQQIAQLQASANVRLYTGLIQGAIIGLVTGGAAAWVVSRRISVVEVEEDE